MTGPSDVFNIFNARLLTPQRVAETFVPPPQYYRLASGNHSVLIGPRGSGKTTLLKMLHPAALAAWSHPDANRVKGQLGFTGVYIRTDSTWLAQVGALGGRNLSPEAHTSIVSAAITLHIIRCLVDSMAFRFQEFSQEAGPGNSAIIEREFSIEVAKALRFSDVFPSFRGLRIALQLELDNIARLARRLSRMTNEEALRALNAEHAANLTPLFTPLSIIEIFGEHIGNTSEKWAFLFDELELAPDWFRSDLFSHIRSVSERIIFKLALSPCVDVVFAERSSSPSSKDDYDEIPLWYIHKQDSSLFCAQLLGAMLRTRDITGLSPIDVFGPSISEESEDTEDSTSSYAPDSRRIMRMKELAENDKSFSAYLKRHSIDLDTAQQMDEEGRARFFRKIVSVVAFRHFFLRKEGGGRSRKSYTIYSGAESIFGMVEGNPRFFIATIRPLLMGVSPADALAASPEQPLISIEEQVKRLEYTSSAFQAYLRTKASPRGRKGNLLEFLDDIGIYFQAQMYGLFRSEPELSFVVDTYDENLEAALKEAIVAGAIIYAPDPRVNPSYKIESTYGKRFRLSYLLHQKYKLPLVLGRPQKLSAILAAEHNPSQLELF